jgi:hypothetical protein
VRDAQSYDMMIAAFVAGVEGMQFDSVYDEEVGPG